LKVTQVIARPVGLLANVLLLVLVGLIIIVHYETLAAIRLRAWAGMGLLLLASLGIGWLCGGPDIRTRKTMAATTAPRNAAVGLVIAASNFTDPAVMAAVVAYGLVSILGTLGCAVLVGRLGAAHRSKEAPAA